MNIAFEEVYVNVTGLQRWFIEFKTDDLSLENKPGEMPLTIMCKERSLKIIHVKRQGR